MNVIERLTKQGKDLGYEGETSQTFVMQQKIEFEQKAMREAEHEAKLEREKLELMEKIECEKLEGEYKKRKPEKEACEAETAKSEAEARIEHEKRETLEKNAHEKIDAAEKHNQLCYDIEWAKLALEQERIDSQQFQQQREYEFKYQLQERQHKDELKRLEAQKALTTKGDD